MILSVDLTEPFPEYSQFLRSNRPIVLACGCFDLLTAGHVQHLREAKRFGKTLIVLITPDRYIDKGPKRPVFSEHMRTEVVDALRCVDYTVINQFPTAVEAIRCFRPDVYVKGKDYSGHGITPELYEEAKVVTRFGGRVEFTDTEELHTTDVIRRLLS